MSLEEQAQGLLDWARYRDLEDKAWLDEDEAWELHTLRDRLGIPRPPPRPRDPGGVWNEELWAETIRQAYMDNLVVRTWLDQQGKIMAETIDREIMYKLGEDDDR